MELIIGAGMVLVGSGSLLSHGQAIGDDQVKAFGIGVALTGRWAWRMGDFLHEYVV
jgi:hypothetical protein